MEIKRGLIDRPNKWDAKPTTPYHMLGLALVLILWSVLGLAVVSFLRGDPDELSSRGQTFGLVLITLIVGFAWIFFLMHLRSLLLVRRLTRGMAHKRFEDMQPGEVIATIEEHLSKEGIRYERLSLVDALPKEYVPGSMHYIKDIFELDGSRAAFLVQPFYHGDDARGLPSNTPVYLGPLTDENWEMVEGLMRAL
jgi:hypothetical protein